MKCPTCGGDNPQHSMQCSYCGSELDAGVPAGPGAVASAVAAIDPFAHIKRSDAYVQRNSPARHARLPTLHPALKTIPLVFIAIFIAAGVFMTIVLVAMAGVFGFVGTRAGGTAGGLAAIVPLFMVIVPIGFVVLGIFGFRHTRRKMNRMETAPIQARPAIVVDKRTHVDGGSGDSSATTTYYATFETEDGRRHELPLWDGRIYGRVAADDAGILYSRDDYALDFDRVALPLPATASE